MMGKYWIIGLSALLLMACGAAPAAPTPSPAPQAATAVPPTAVPPTVAPTANVAATVEAAVKATIAAAPTSTVAPPPTLAPTSAPTKPIATSKEPLTAEKVIAAFKLAGLEAVNPTKMARQDYGLAPFVGEGVRFLIPSVCGDCGGRVFAVPDARERSLIANYYRELGKASAAFYSHVFERDNIVVQINGDLKDDQAAKYEAALKSMQ